MNNLETQLAVMKTMAAFAAGEIRKDISCDEARREWFHSARQVYVNGGEPRFPIDAEVGHHMAGCDTSGCRTLIMAYYALLRPGHADPQAIAAALNQLESTIT